MTREPLHVHPVSIELAWNDPEENLRRVEAELRERLARAGDVPPEAQLFVLPELTLTGFVTETPPSYALAPAHPTPRRVLELAARLRTGVVFGFPEQNLRNPRKPFNAVALAGPDGRVVCDYRKLHLFTAGKHPEAATYTAGDSAKTCVYRGWKLGFAVCFDARFPGLFHQYARAGVDAVLLSSCWVGGPHKSYQYRTLASAHAILMQAYVVAVNAGGRDPYAEYDGAQYVFSPFGEDLYQGGPVRLDPSELEACRRLQVRGSDREYRVVAHPRPAP